MRYEFTASTKVCVLKIGSKISFIFPILWKFIPCELFTSEAKDYVEMRDRHLPKIVLANRTWPWAKYWLSSKLGELYVIRGDLFSP